MEGLPILRYHRGLRKLESLKKRKFNMPSHSFYDTELLLCRWNEYSIVHVIEWLIFHGHKRGVANKRYITYKSSITEKNGYLASQSNCMTLS